MQTVLKQIDDSGNFTPDVALQAFSLAFGPLPNVELPAADESDVPSGTLALRMLLVTWDQIDDDQREAALALVPDLLKARPSSADSAAPAVALVSSDVPAASPDTAALQQISDDSFAYLLAKTGLADPGWRPRIEYGTHPKASAVAYTLAYPGGCDIGLVAARFDPRETSIKRYTIGHEAFHCLESLVPSTDSWSPWLFEGLATWAGVQVPMGGDGPLPSWYFYGSTSPDFWQSYFADAQRSLYSRSYDAFGFFWLVTEHGVDLWHLWPDLPADDREAFDAVTGDTDALTDWASGFFRDPSHPGWDLHGPGVPKIRPADLEDVVPVPNGTTKIFPILEASVDFSRFSTDADIVDITLDGIGRLRLGDGSEPSVPAHSASYCTRTDACACPPNTVPKDGPLPQLPPGEFAIALTGGDRPGSFTVTGHAFNPAADCTPAPLGSWRLSSFRIDGAEFSVAYTLTGGDGRVDISPNGTTEMVIDADFAAQIQFGDDAQTVPLHVLGRSNTTIKVDASASALTWVSQPDEAHYVITVDGTEVTDSELGGPAAFEPAAVMSYRMDGDTVEWIYAVEGGTATWTWHR